MDRNGIERTLRNILQMLQTEPARYRHFGVYWWPVKALLKHYYTTENLYLLGGYEDPDGVARLPDLGLEEMLGAAIEEYRANAMFNPGSARVVDPEGEAYTVYDEDAGL